MVIFINYYRSNILCSKMKIHTTKYSTLSINISTESIRKLQIRWRSYFNCTSGFVVKCRPRNPNFGKILKKLNWLYHTNPKLQTLNHNQNVHVNTEIFLTEKCHTYRHHLIHHSWSLRQIPNLSRALCVFWFGITDCFLCSEHTTFRGGMSGLETYLALCLRLGGTVPGPITASFQVSWSPTRVAGRQIPVTSSPRSRSWCL